MRGVTLFETEYTPKIKKLLPLPLLLLLLPPPPPVRKFNLDQRLEV